jgi:hypothetical protein
MRLRRTIRLLPLALPAFVSALCAACSEGPSSATSPTCSFRVTVQTESFGPAGGKGTATVSTASGCVWAASSTADWISVSSGTAGNGDGQVGFSVAAFDGSADRSGSLVVAKQAVAIAQKACSVQFSPTEQSFSDVGSVRDVNVQAQPGCSWSLEGVPSWLTVTPSTGTGEATIKIQVSENNDTQTREATIRTGNAALSVKQGGEAVRCDLALDVQPAQFNETGGSGIVAVNTRDGCQWQLASDADWVRVTTSSGTGPARIAFNVLPSAQPGDRRAMLRADGATGSVVQLANQCAFSVTPVQRYAHSSGDSGTVAIRATAGCQWTASPAATWIHIDRASGTGSGEIRYTVDPYAEPVNFARKAPIEVRWKTPTLGENAWVWQLSDCQVGFGMFPEQTTPGVHMPTRNVVAFPVEGGATHVTMLFQYFRCEWIAESLPAMPFTVNPGRGLPLNVIQDREWDLHISVPPNTTGRQLTTSMVVGEATLILTQSAK